MGAAAHFTAEQSCAFFKTTKTFGSRLRRKNHSPAKTSGAVPANLPLAGQTANSLPRFEFLGDGAERPALERALPQRPQFLFHGIRQGNDYWQILANWAVILLTSDHESVPRVILEGMHRGVLPIVPKIDAEADRYAQSIDSRLCYKPANIKSAAAAIERLSKLPEANVNLRRQCRQTAQKHLDGKAYCDTFQNLVRAVQKMPRISEVAPPRSEQFDDVPFRWLQRIGKIPCNNRERQKPLGKDLLPFFLLQRKITKPAPPNQ